MSASRALARVNLAAIERNCARLRRELAGTSQLCAVVKADGYGHGAICSAGAALAGGAAWLAVATSGEAIELRAALRPRDREQPPEAHAPPQARRPSPARDAPILVMGALGEQELRDALRVRADVVVWQEAQVQGIAALGGGRVHVKLDTGMGRLGTRDREQATRVTAAAARTPGVELAGVMTHFATADQTGDGFFEEQLRHFTAWATEVKRQHPDVIVHAANSAATLREAASHFDMVRCGIALYGLDPANRDPLAHDLEPALELHSYVAEVKLCEAGQSAGYGRRFQAVAPTHIGILPIGYGDGFRRGLSDNCDVIVEGRRRPLVGTVSMDNITVDLGPGQGARELLGKDAVLIGCQGPERIGAEEIAGRLETINYEVTCGLSARVPRLYHRDGRVGHA